VTNYSFLTSKLH